MHDQPYHPIDCSFYDRLEEAATLRRFCSIEVSDPDGVRMLEDRIIDLRIVDGAEWMFLAGGTQVRLDHLIRIDGHLVPGSCGLPRKD
ncbi:MAG: hypothetical protein K9I85_10590 [Saprospiraceae bacterium]|nr:hypothetical protein [Saprospiraceae bacterium]